MARRSGHAFTRSKVITYLETGDGFFVSIKDSVDKEQFFAGENAGEMPADA